MKTLVSLALLVSMMAIIGCDSPKVVSRIRIRRDATSPNLSHKETDAEFKSFAETQRTLITSPFILNAALRKPGIMELGLIQQQPKPLDWLADHVKVHFLSDSEIVMIELASPKTEDAAKVVDAIVHTYLYEIGQSEKTERTRQLSTLKTQQRRNERLITEKTEIVNRLTVPMKGSSADSQTMIQRKADLVERELLAVSDAARALRLEKVTVDRDAALQLAEKLALLEAERSELTIRHEALCKSIDDQKVDVKQSGVLAAKRHELANLVEANREVAKLVSQLELELLKPNRIQLIQPATIEDGSD